ncbi:MAG: DUF3307 domain-containing protein [Flavobacterium sp.]
MIVFVKLLLAHLLGDFLLQPTSWVLDKESKKHKSIYLYAHTLLHGALAMLFVWEKEFIFYAIGLAVLHGFIDFLKLKFQTEATKRNWFLLDQLLHLIVIIGISWLYVDVRMDEINFSERFWVILTAVIFLTKPTSFLIKNIISVWTPENKLDKKDDSLMNAGNYIGMLERIFVFYFIISGHFEATGFLLAAKSIFRFGDLTVAKDRKLTEYVLIGTLLSFGIAILIGSLCQLPVLL